MDKYVLHGDFYNSDMDNMDVILGYPWMELVSIVNINVQKKFMKLWYTKNKITLQNISIKTQAKTMEAEAQSSNDTDTSDDQPLMVGNQTQTSNQVPEKQVVSKEAEVENVTGTHTSDEEPVLEVILEDKKQQAPPQIPDTNQAPLGGELKKHTPLVKTLAYHHPHHPTRKQPTR